MRLLWGRYGWYVELGEAPTAANNTEEGQLPVATGSQPAAASEEAGKEGPAAGRGRPGRKKKAASAAAAKPKPRRASLGRGADAPDISLEDALQLLAWPKVRTAPWEIPPLSKPVEWQLGARMLIGTWPLCSILTQCCACTT